MCLSILQFIRVALVEYSMVGDEAVPEITALVVELSCLDDVPAREEWRRGSSA